jgi:hypothetical protein
MKKKVAFLTTFLTTLSLGACAFSANPTANVSADSDSGQSAAAAVVDTPAQNTSEKSPAAGAALLTKSSDFSYDPSKAVTITLQGDTIQADSEGVRVEGSRAVVTEPGTYVLSGSLTNGQIMVETDSKDTVRLVLNGVNIHCDDSAPLYIANAKKVVMVLADRSENTFSDGSDYQFAVPDDEEPNAAVFSKADLIIGGGGSLTVTANFNDGVTSKDGLVIAGGNIMVNAVDDGLRGKDYLALEGGVLTVFAGGDGLKSDNDKDAGKGNITMTNTSLTVTAGGDAVNAQTRVSITDGDLNLTSGGGSAVSAGEDTSAKGIKAGFEVIIAGGEITIDSADDGIHSNASITIDDGSFRIASGDDGMHADENLTVNGGVIQITRSYEGLESALISINDGVIQIAASDDGVNVAGGNDASGMRPGMMPGGGQNRDAFTYSGSNYLHIRGGYLYIDALGDGIDVNGAIEMTGGLVVISGPTAQMNGALDYDAGFKMNGGSIIAAGSSGMAMAPDNGSGQPSVLIHLASSQPAGSVLNIQNQAGESILTFAPAKDYQSIAFSSPMLLQGQTYTVYTGGQVSGSVVDGLLQDGSYSAGTQAAVFTISGAVTYAGTAANTRPGGGGQPGGGPRGRP